MPNSLMSTFVTSRALIVIFVLTATWMAVITPTDAKGADPYYKVPPIFLPCPKSTGNKAWNVPNFGPVGVGISLKPQQGSFEMEINNVEPNSPAAATGKLKKGQIIESINGRVLKDLDPRIILGDLITEAEATDGKMVLKIKGVGNVLVKIPVMGSYSDTWPVNCPKSDKIVRQLADVIAKQESPHWGSVLFMLSTGEEKDLDVVKKWMGGKISISSMQWSTGYHGIGICEYYLRTGDKRVLPVIAEGAEYLKNTMYNGGWSGRGIANFTYSTGSGQLHAAGVHCMSFLMLARMCGVEVDDYTFNRSLEQFYRFGGRGNVAYGDTWPEGGFRDNGKTSGLAVAMAYATRLTPNGEDTVYAEARDNSAMKAFYATNWFHAAHTGGGMGEIWHHAAMGIMREKRPTPYRSYLDTRRWVMDLSRRHDGSIGIAGMEDRYDKSATEHDRSWGTYFALTYTAPRKTLQLFGAPKTPWCQTFELPQRPWGTANDDIFNSPEPATGSSLTMSDMMNEKVLTDASLGVFAQLGNSNITDDVLLKYIHHPEYAFRNAAMDKVVEYNRDHLIVPLMRSSDPRLRHAGVMAVAGMFKGNPLPSDRITPEMWQLIGNMIEDPDESWWVKVAAMQGLARANPQIIANHVDRLLELLGAEQWWISAAAAKPLSILAVDPNYYKRILPPLVKSITESQTTAGMNNIYALTKYINRAKPEVKNFAVPIVEKVYVDIPGEYKEERNDLTLPGKANYVKQSTAWLLKDLPGGEAFVESLPKMTSAARRSGSPSDMYEYSGKFTPNAEFVGRWIRIGTQDPKELPKWIAHWKKSGSKPPKSVYSFNLLDNGKIKGEVFLKKLGQGWFWSGDMMIGRYTDEAKKMRVKTIDGVEFLFVEKGGFGTIENAEANPDPKWDNGYEVYVKDNSAKKGKK